MSSSFEKFFADQFSSEPMFQERIKIAVDRAKAIVAATELNTEEAIINRMKYIVSQHFKIPFHSPFFDDLTFDDLMLEVMLVSETSKDSTERTGETIKENKVEAQDAFGDLMEEDGESSDSEIESLEVPDGFSEEEQEFINTKGKSFMQGGFAGIRQPS
jgi:hypothetical protein